VPAFPLLRNQRGRGRKSPLASFPLWVLLPTEESKKKVLFLPLLCREQRTEERKDPLAPQPKDRKNGRINVAKK